MCLHRVITDTFKTNGQLLNGTRRKYRHAKPLCDHESLTNAPREARLTMHKRIKAYCDAIVREFHPLQIILFGSYAYGRPRPDSDVDLLIVMPFRGSDVRKAVEIRSRFDTPFPMDLIVRKPKFIADRQRERDMFIELVMTRGKVLYESKHA